MHEFSTGRLHRVSLTQDMVEMLGRSIVAGEYAASGFPTEGELERRLGVSHSVVREAIKILKAKRLLSARPRVGTVTEPETHWNLLDPDVLRWLSNREATAELLVALTEVRLAFEPHAAAMAARCADQARRTAIKRAIERMRAAVTDGGDQIATDIDFHVAVLEASGNPFFLQLRELIHTALRVSTASTHKILRPSETLALHEQTAAAILAHDEDGAYEVMRQMMLDTLSILRSIASAEPLIPADGVFPERLDTSG